MVLNQTLGPLSRITIIAGTVRISDFKTRNSRDHESETKVTRRAYVKQVLVEAKQHAAET